MVNDLPTGISSGVMCVNAAGTLHYMTNITANVSGTLKRLRTITANSGGNLKIIHDQVISLAGSSFPGIAAAGGNIIGYVDLRTTNWYVTATLTLATAPAIATSVTVGGTTIATIPRNSAAGKYVYAYVLSPVASSITLKGNPQIEVSWSLQFSRTSMPVGTVGSSGDVTI